MGGTWKTMNGYKNKYFTPSIKIDITLLPRTGTALSYYSQTCIKRLHLGQRKCGSLRQVTPIKKFSSCEIIYDRTKNVTF